MDNIAICLALDIATVLLALTLLQRSGLSALHPGVIYLFYHGFAVTLRGILITCGSPTLFADSVGLGEICRAILAGDLALFCGTLGWLFASRHPPRRSRVRTGSSTLRLVSCRALKWVSLVCFLAGTMGLIFFGRSGVYPSGVHPEFGFTGYAYVLIFWPIQSLLLLIYWKGFRPLLLTVFAGLIVFTSTQMLRYGALLGLLMFAFIYLSRNHRRWFPAFAYPAWLALIVVFFGLRVFSWSVVRGESIITALKNTRDYYSSTVLEQRGGPDTQLLDMTASVMTLTDRSGGLQLGRTWLPAFVAPIPRQLWPQKPMMNQAIRTISEPDRPMGIRGMVPGFAGDAYMNGGYLGIAAIPFLFAWATGRFYLYALAAPHHSIRRLAYLLLATNLIQVYRDGLISLFLFTTANWIPFVLVAVLSAVARPSRVANRQFALSVPISVSAYGRCSARNCGIHENSSYHSVSPEEPRRPAQGLRRALQSAPATRPQNVYLN